MTWLTSVPKSVKPMWNYLGPPTGLCSYHNKQCQGEVLIVKPLDFIHRLDQHLELYSIYANVPASYTIPGKYVMMPDYQTCFYIHRNLLYSCFLFFEQSSVSAYPTDRPLISPTLKKITNFTGSPESSYSTASFHSSNSNNSGSR